MNREHVKMCRVRERSARMQGRFDAANMWREQGDAYARSPRPLLSDREGLMPYPVECVPGYDWL